MVGALAPTFKGRGRDVRRLPGARGGAARRVRFRRDCRLRAQPAGPLGPGAAPAARAQGRGRTTGRGAVDRGGPGDSARDGEHRPGHKRQGGESLPAATPACAGGLSPGGGGPHLPCRQGRDCARTAGRLSGGRVAARRGHRPRGADSGLALHRRLLPAQPLDQLADSVSTPEHRARPARRAGSAGHLRRSGAWPGRRTRARLGRPRALLASARRRAQPHLPRDQGGHPTHRGLPPPLRAHRGRRAQVAGRHARAGRDVRHLDRGFTSRPGERTEDSTHVPRRGARGGRRGEDDGPAGALHPAESARGGDGAGRGEHLQLAVHEAGGG